MNAVLAAVQYYDPFLEDGGLCIALKSPDVPLRRWFPLRGAFRERDLVLAFLAARVHDQPHLYPRWNCAGVRARAECSILFQLECKVPLRRWFPLRDALRERYLVLAFLAAGAWLLVLQVLRERCLGPPRSTTPPFPWSLPCAGSL